MRRVLPFVLSVAFFLSACNFSVGSNKDFSTGLSYSYKGFRVDDVLLTKVDAKGKKVVLWTNKIPLHTEVAVVIKGLDNYKLKNGKAYPGVEYHVTDQGGRELVGSTELFAKNDGFYEASSMSLQFKVSPPMKAGKKYPVNIRIWDKNNPTSELTAQLDIEVI